MMKTTAALSCFLLLGACSSWNSGPQDLTRPLLDGREISKVRLYGGSFPEILQHLSVQGRHLEALELANRYIDTCQNDLDRDLIRQIVAQAPEAGGLRLVLTGKISTFRADWRTAMRQAAALNHPEGLRWWAYDLWNQARDIHDPQLRAAADIMKRAATSGDAVAAYHLSGFAFVFNNRTDQRYYRGLAANMGNPEAQASTARSLEDDLPEEAAWWHRRSRARDTALYEPLYSCLRIDK